MLHQPDYDGSLPLNIKISDASLTSPTTTSLLLLLLLLLLLSSRAVCTTQPLRTGYLCKPSSEEVPDPTGDPFLFSPPPSPAMHVPCTVQYTQYVFFFSLLSFHNPISLLFLSRRLHFRNNSYAQYCELRRKAGEI
ncbi:hypothetical protein F5B20DRAFT_533059 [Whalleya microplaca]|nr:hypothetical protein F5B20DRAFT_533059 [Whalleya microplaca]